PAHLLSLRRPGPRRAAALCGHCRAADVACFGSARGQREQRIRGSLALPSIDAREELIPPAVVFFAAHRDLVRRERRAPRGAPSLRGRARRDFEGEPWGACETERVWWQRPAGCACWVPPSRPTCRPRRGPC